MKEILAKFLCKWKHDWEFDGGQWITRDISTTTRKCKRCGLKQDIEHYHLIPNYVCGQQGHGIAVLDKERRPEDPDYDFKYEMNERPVKKYGGK